MSGCSAMDDLDRLLAETLHRAAVHAPADNGLLAIVHRRSDRRHRRRIATTLVALAVALALAVPAMVRLERRTPENVVSGVPAVHLVAGWTAPVFPYTLPASAGLKAPVASMDGGDLIGFFEATEQRHHADTTVTVSSAKPSFTGPAAETTVQVRGQPGTLRTVDVQPAEQLTLVWREPSGRWITLATDDTYREQQVVGLADDLTPASVPVRPPFRLDLTPDGFVTDTVTESTMTFRAPAGEMAGEMKVVLRGQRPLVGADRTVGSYPASLTRGASGAVLDVDVTDWQATLEVTVDLGIPMSDSDLLRFAAGVHILNRSNPR
jgi:hypothetical protein